MKGNLKILLLSLPFMALQACSSPQPNVNSNDNTPKGFGERFSTENIKQAREAFYAQKRAELKRISPSQKVSQALRNNDIYLMTVMAGRGVNRSIPGLVESNVMPVNCRMVPAEGFGDTLYGKNHILYRQDMLAFMREFNVLMAPYCK